jgi:hypothetical protein
MPKITYQHTYTFTETGESVTIYIADNSDNFYMALSFRHDETADSLKWTTHFEGILQLKSQVHDLVWYIYLTDYWMSGTGIMTERVMIVMDCNAHHHKLKR